ncbi:hypothetical protein SELMODRAFT_79269 [Selaginella moellendorffii]|uniref:tRNA (adenine(58)-N(1))-methyltransferase n=2 Tax=Selaginella moellendorffii TaxID=88036 RepID=D8QU12_SELML|nr:hypothetical protein SELMODRAFT_79269 [Selaginella moellendorffii]
MAIASSSSIREGDVVIVYERHDRMKAVTVRKGGELQNRFGVFRHDDWIGKPFGSRVVDKKKGSGFVYLLAPSPVLWTLVLSHRTQILYLADISFVICGLELRPGCVVLESGTGSGSLTTSLARAVAPSGHVHTFDFHEPRASLARKDFENNRINNVTVGVRDIQGQGFPEELTDKANAVFLDLPQPWLAVESVLICLRPNASCCSFSPCIEQVQRTCEAFRKYNFVDIRTFEVLLRSYEIRKEFLTDISVNNGEVEDASLPPQKRRRSDSSEKPRPDGGDAPNPSIGAVMARPYAETKGHTGFLTFARCQV